MFLFIKINVFNFHVSVRQNTFQCRSYASKVKPFKRPTMNDLPKPGGSWAELHAKRNKRGNINLGIGVGVFSFSVFVVSITNFFFFHRKGQKNYIYYEILSIAIIVIHKRF